MLSVAQENGDVYFVCFICHAFLAFTITLNLNCVLITRITKCLTHVYIVFMESKSYIYIYIF